MSFKDLIQEEGILKAVADAGFENPTPIQEQAIPVILGGYDMRASAQTGTGKTAAYLLPIIQRLTQPRLYEGISPRILILVPTRELAIQVAEEAMKYTRHMTKMKTVCIYGGAPYPIQIRELSRAHEILVATPGRLIDHLNSRRVDLSKIETLILDEADRMLDMGFIEPVEQIAAATPQVRQTLLFSATMQGSVLRLSRNLLKNPKEIVVSHEHAKHENIEQRLYHVDDLHHKYRLLNHLINEPEVKQVIIFTATKRFADQLVDEMYDLGVKAAGLHGDMNQRQRTRTIQRLREGQIRVLIATDVAARGIDVQTITHVINFDLPRSVEDYVHRIGRTGRAGANGLAYSFAAPNERQLVSRIEQFTGQPIMAHTVAGMEPTARARGSFEPNKRRSGGGGQRGPSRSGGGGGGGRFAAPRSNASRSGAPRGNASRSNDSRSDDSRGNDSRSYAPRSDAPRSFAPRSNDSRGNDSRGNDSRPYAPRSDSPRGNDSRPFTPRSDSPRGNDSRPYAPRGNGPRGNDSRGNDSRGNDSRGNDSRSEAPRSRFQSRERY